MLGGAWDAGGGLFIAGEPPSSFVAIFWETIFPSPLPLVDFGGGGGGCAGLGGQRANYFVWRLTMGGFCVGVGFGGVAGCILGPSLFWESYG